MISSYEVNTTYFDASFGALLHHRPGILPYEVPAVGKQALSNGNTKTTTSVEDTLVTSRAKHLFFLRCQTCPAVLRE